MEKLISKYFVPGKTFSIDEYIADGGYQAIRTVFEKLDSASLIETVKKSNLRGLGGAGFPCGIKWSFVPQNTGKPVYLVVNADEGEPGTFKDKYIISHVPHLLIEGIMIAAFANNVHKAFIYIRGEYTRPYQALVKAVNEAYEKGYLGKNIFGKGFGLDIVVHRGAGAYICGEETGLLESLEGKQGRPRLKPPFPAVVGLFGCPTVINNVETLSYLPFIINRGAEWFASLGSDKNGGMRLFSVSGHVKKPGVYELPLGIPLREIIYTYAGGIRDDRRLKAVVPGGLSAAILKADEIDVGMDFDQLRAKQTMAGSAGVIVMDEKTCMVRSLLVTMRFYAHESCGQCSPCREGTGWVHRILERIASGGGKSKDLENLSDICSFMGGTTICALADGAAMPLRSYPQKFKEEFEYFIRHGKSMIEQGEEVSA
ncbi:MAG: NADH-quinone oxidoreductase subunit NuoF [Candidatus Omnitrophica bacterium]|nr:NADH-quinone oxidoreductase subunit NuoF [Candidatus Omnitrophota bacterium]